MESTKREQQPYIYGSLSRNMVYLKPPQNGSPAPAEDKVQQARLPQPSDPLQLDLATDCDRLAASPFDPQRPRGVAGVALDQIHIMPALAACNAAMTRYPDVARFAYQAGRIAHNQKNYPTARQHYDKAASLGSMAAANNLGALAYDVSKDHTEARKWFEKAAAGGLPDSMRALGKFYQDGDGVSQDYGEARKWYEKGAAAGDAGSMARLGNLYYDAKSVPQDYSEARRWYEKGAAAGNAECMVRLGNLYYEGKGVPQDYGEARNWYEKAAAAGDSGGVFNLGLLYQNGKGVPQDYGEARKWYERAAAAGNEDAKRALEKVKDEQLQNTLEHFRSK
jgi:TPR repeat protein